MKNKVLLITILCILLFSVVRAPETKADGLYIREFTINNLVAVAVNDATLHIAMDSASDITWAQA